MIVSDMIVSDSKFKIGDLVKLKDAVAEGPLRQFKNEIGRVTLIDPMANYPILVAFVARGPISFVQEELVFALNGVEQMIAVL
jgi:hypothetical protein